MMSLQVVAILVLAAAAVLADARSTRPTRAFPVKHGHAPLVGNPEFDADGHPTDLANLASFAAAELQHNQEQIMENEGVSAEKRMLWSAGFNMVTTGLGILGNYLQRDKCKLLCCPKRGLSGQWACKYKTTQAECNGGYSDYKGHGDHACHWNTHANKCEVGPPCRDNTFSGWALVGSTCPPCPNGRDSITHMGPQFTPSELKQSNLPAWMYIYPGRERVWCAPKGVGGCAGKPQNQCNGAYSDTANGDFTCKWDTRQRACVNWRSCTDDRPNPSGLSYNAAKGGYLKGIISYNAATGGYSREIRQLDADQCCPGRDCFTKAGGKCGALPVPPRESGNPYLKAQIEAGKREWFQLSDLAGFIPGGPGKLASTFAKVTKNIDNLVKTVSSVKKLDPVLVKRLQVAKADIAKGEAQMKKALELGELASGTPAPAPEQGAEYSEVRSCAKGFAWRCRKRCGRGKNKSQCRRKCRCRRV